MYQVDVAYLRAWRRADAGTADRSRHTSEASPTGSTEAALPRDAAVPGARRIPATVLRLGAVSAITDVSSEMVASVLPVFMLTSLGFSPMALGVVDGLYQGVSALVQLAGGVVADRWRSHKAVAAVGYILSAITKLGFLLPGIGAGAIAGLVTSDRLGKGIRTAPRDAMIAAAAVEGEMAAAFGAHRALDAAGAVAGPLVAYLVLLSAPGDFSAVFLLSFIIALVGVGVLVLLVQPAGETAPARAPFTLNDLAPMLASPRFRSVAAVGALAGLTVMSDAFLYLILQRRAGLGVETLPLFYVGASAAFMLLAVPVGRLADRIGRSTVYIAGLITMMVVYAAALFAPPSAAIVVIGVALVGVYYAATDGVVAALASRVLPAPLRASGLGAVASATNLAKLLGSMLVGAIWTLRGPEAALACCLVGTGLAIVVVARRLARADRDDDDRGMTGFGPPEGGPHVPDRGAGTEGMLA